MRAIQKIIIIIYCILVAVACIYVPWTGMRYFDAKSPEVLTQGYTFFWKHSFKYTIKWADKFGCSSENVYTCDMFIDYKRMVLELIALTAIFVMLFILTLKPKKD
jgi:DNA-binding transcriptional regulator of glucitol operon